MSGLADIASASRAPLHAATTARDPASLLALVRESDLTVTAEEYAAARVCASEYGDGTPAEMACVVDVMLNQARRRGRSLVRHLTRGGDFGEQGKEGRPASTRLVPNRRHLAVARAVLGGELRGIALDAELFFNARLQEKLHRRWKSGRTKKVHSCSALGLLRAWSFDLPAANGRRCGEDGNPPVANPGSRTQGWVGEIPGVDSLALMLLKPMPAGEAHQRAFEAARALIAKQTDPGAVLVASLPMVLMLVGGALALAAVRGG